MSTLYLGAPRGEDDVNGILPILSSAFGSDLAGVRTWIEIAGPGSFRLIDAGDGPAACLGTSDIGQYFGGEVVPMWGVYGVATDPAQRGRGHARTLMDAHVRECRENGVAISTLFPATHYLYRRSGYERAGETYHVSLHPGHIDVRERPLQIRPAAEGDTGAIERVYASCARGQDGQLARRSYIWPRVRAPRGNPSSGYVVTRAGEIEGYVYFTLKQTHDFMLRMTVHDIAATGPDAFRTLLRFIADHRSTCREMEMPIAPSDPLLLLLGEFHHATRLTDYWMVRVVDVGRAIETRGYPRALSLRFALEITEDTLLPENSGTWAVEVHGGHASVDRVGDARDLPVVRADIRTFAPMYSGFMSASELARTGRVSGDAEAIDRASEAFRSGRVWMSTRF